MASIAIQDHPERVRYPLMGRPLIGFLLAFIAGSLNAWTLAHAKTFATVQSGNIVQIGYWFAQKDWDKFMFPFLSVIAFGVGSMACGILMTSQVRVGRNFTPVVLFFEASALAILGYLAHRSSLEPQYIAYAVSFIAGAQGNAYHRNNGMLYGNVAVTFVVQAAFNFLIQSFFNKTGINGEPNLKWAALFFSILFAFAGGGAIGFLVDQQYHGAALYMPAAIAAVLFVISFRDRESDVRVDPLSGGLIA